MSKQRKMWFRNSDFYTSFLVWIKQTVYTMLTIKIQRFRLADFVILGQFFVIMLS